MGETCCLLFKKTSKGYIRNKTKRCPKGIPLATAHSPPRFAGGAVSVSVDKLFQMIRSMGFDLHYHEIRTLGGCRNGKGRNEFFQGVGPASRGKGTLFEWVRLSWWLGAIFPCLALGFVLVHTHMGCRVFDIQQK